MSDKLFYDNSSLCHICNKNIGEDRTRDHCHLSHNFRGADHKDKVLKNFPVVFRNFSGYDSHLFIKTLENSEEDISY